MIDFDLRLNADVVLGPPSRQNEYRFLKGLIE
jgi:hypothetical protein